MLSLLIIFAHAYVSDTIFTAEEQQPHAVAWVDFPVAVYDVEHPTLGDKPIEYGEHEFLHILLSLQGHGRGKWCIARCHILCGVLEVISLMVLGEDATEGVVDVYLCPCQ